MRDPKNHVCVITGAASGMGREMAVALAAKGATVVVVARDAARVDEAIAGVRERVAGAAVEGVVCDLSQTASVKKAAAEIAAKHPKIDLLVNNAAVFLPTRTTTSEGYETCFAVNALAPFVMTRALEPQLAAARGRVVHVTMGGASPMAFDDPQSTKKYSSLAALKQSKSATQYFTKEMAQRYRDNGVDVVCVDPGLTQSKLPSLAPLPLRLFFKLFGKTPEHGARVPLAACLDDARYPSGTFVNDKGAATALPEFVDDITARRAWDLCAGLARA